MEEINPLYLIYPMTYSPSYGSIYKHTIPQHLSSKPIYHTQILLFHSVQSIYMYMLLSCQLIWLPMVVNTDQSPIHTQIMSKHGTSSTKDSLIRSINLKNPTRTEVFIFVRQLFLKSLLNITARSVITMQSEHYWCTKHKSISCIMHVCKLIFWR